MLHIPRIVWIPATAFAFAAACGDDNLGTTVDDGGVTLNDGGAGVVGGDGGGAVVVPASCNGSVASISTPADSLPSLPSGLAVVSGFVIEVVASINAPRELAALPNGDILVGTNGDGMYLIPNAEADAVPGKSVKFATAQDGNPAGVTFVPTTCAIYWGTNAGIYKATYNDGDVTGDFGTAPIAKVRQGSSGGHATTSVAFANGMLYASVGSSCNACTETDVTRASIQQLNPDGSNMTTKAAHIRNAIAITTNPDTGTLWAGGAGQDDLPEGHPYEFFDAVTSHTEVVDYGWPDCEENHNAFGSGADCSNQAEPR
ncbi:MAG: PQQ-dependent sugar dehydrogenase, partial [Polyangiaceae bacterium]